MPFLTDIEHLLNRYQTHHLVKGHSAINIARILMGHGKAGAKRYEGLKRTFDQNKSNASRCKQSIAQTYITLCSNEKDHSISNSTLLTAVKLLLMQHLNISETKVLNCSPSEPVAQSLLGVSVCAGRRYDTIKGLSAAIQKMQEHQKL